MAALSWSRMSLRVQSAAVSSEFYVKHFGCTVVGTAGTLQL